MPRLHIYHISDPSTPLFKPYSRNPTEDIKYFLANGIKLPTSMLGIESFFPAHSITRINIDWEDNENSL